MPLFLHSNSTPTIPHELRHLQRSKFPHGCADAADESGRKGSNVYEVNQWMWEFGRGKPRLGGLSVTETEERRIAVRTEAGRRAQSTREVRRGKATKAGAAKWCGNDIPWWKDWTWDIPMPTNCPAVIPWCLKLNIGYWIWLRYRPCITLLKYLY